MQPTRFGIAMLILITLALLARFTGTGGSVQPGASTTMISSVNH